MEGLTTNFWDFTPKKNGCRGTGVTLDQIIMQHLPEPIEGGEGLKKGWKMDDTFPCKI